MTTTFQKIIPEKVDEIPAQAIKYLEDAVIRTPASTSRIDVTMDIAKKGYGNIYLIHIDQKLTGACYLLVYPTKLGKVIAPVLVGGDNMHLWHDDFYDFVQEFSRKLEGHKIRWIGRKGWHKAYPKSRVIGYVYEHDVDY